MPGEVWLKSGVGSEFKVKDSAMSGGFRPGRGMEDEWRHQEEVAGVAFAGDGVVFFKIRDLGGRNSSQTMASGNDLQRSVGSRGRVEVDPEGDHMCEKVDRWLDVDDFVFGRPWAVPWNVVLIRDGDGEVLVPSDRPILFPGLVKKNTANGPVIGLLNEAVSPVECELMELFGFGAKVANACLFVLMREPLAFNACCLHGCFVKKFANEQISFFIEGGRKRCSQGVRLSQRWRNGI